MSYSTWTEYGYGICASDIPFNQFRIRELLDIAPGTRESVDRFFRDNDIIDPSEEDYNAYDGDYEYGVSLILQQVIEECTGVVCEVCRDFDGNIFVIYPPLYPWQMTRKDYCVTEEQLSDIFHKYIHVLTDEDIKVSYQEINNGG